MTIKIKILLLGVLFGQCFLGACGDDPNQLTPEEKYIVDSLYNGQLTLWRLKIDSICTAQRDTIYNNAVDSIKKQRMEEIEMLMMKN